MGRENGKVWGGRMERYGEGEWKGIGRENGKVWGGKR